MSRRQSTRTLVPLVCGGCRTPLPLEAAFCPGCGRRVEPGRSEPALAGNAAIRNNAPLKNEAPDPAQDLPCDLPPRYRLSRMLGRGGMGIVLHCIDLQLERPVAIKMIADRYNADPEAQQRFLREARTQAVINHVNVARILNVGLTPLGRLFMVMEYIEGEDLRHPIQRQPSGIHPLRCCEILRQVCAGLAEAHAARIIHRDLKPSNLMVQRDHRGEDLIKILDLGLAKMIGSGQRFKSLAADTSGIVVGTPAYISPEQISGGAVDGRTDIYALGVVAFELLTGRLPFESENVEGWLYQHLHVNPPAPSRFRPELARYPDLDRLVVHCLAKRPKGRPQHVDGLGQELQRCAQRCREAQARECSLVTQELPISRDVLPQAQPPQTANRPPAQAWPNAPAPPPGTPQAEHAPSRDQARNGSERRRERFRSFSEQAEEAEAQRRWDVAIEQWAQAAPYSSDPEVVQARIGNLEREISFEKVLAEASACSSAGEWSRAIETLQKAAELMPGDARIGEVRRRMPRRLANAWLEAASARLSRFPDRLTQQLVLRRLAVIRARLGDLPRAMQLLQEESGEQSVRIVGLAQAAAAAVLAGHRESVSPYLERAIQAARGLEEPLVRGQAFLELGKACWALGDTEGAKEAFFHARAGLGVRLAARTGLEQGPEQEPLYRTGAFARLSRTTRMLKTPPRDGREHALLEVARSQAEAGLVDEAIVTADLLRDPWNKALALTHIAQALARYGADLEAARMAERVAFTLPKAQALRGLAISRIQRGNLVEAEEILARIALAEARAPVQGHLAAAWARKGDRARAARYAQDALDSALEVPTVVARIEALIQSSQMLVELGEESLAEILLGAASRIIDGAEEAGDRLHGFLQLYKIHQTRKLAQAATGPAGASSPAPRDHEVENLLRRAIWAFAQLHEPSEREEYAGALAEAVSAAGVHELVAELRAQHRSDVELALLLGGLAKGMGTGDG